MGSDRMFPRYAFYKPFTVTFPNKCERRNRFNPDNKGELVWYTDWPKTNKRQWCWGVWMWLEMGHSFSLGLHIMAFQAEIYAIKDCVMENREKGYTGRNIYILSDGQTGIKGLKSFQISWGIPRETRIIGSNWCECWGTRELMEMRSLVKWPDKAPHTYQQNLRLHLVYLQRSPLV
jgi:hypothetical protein